MESVRKVKQLKKDNPQKSKSFFENNSWYHRTKELREDGTVKYSKKGGFATSKEADKSYDRYEAAFKEASRKYHLTHQINGEMMFKDYLIYWFEEVFSARVELTTRMVGAYALYNLILPCMEYDIKVKYTNADYLDSLLERVAKATESAGSTGRAYLNMAMKEAVIAGYIKNNPVAATKPYKRKKPKIVILNKERIKILLRAAKKTNWYLEILLALFCGLRKGELLGLKFSDFDFEKNTVCINRQLVANPIIRKGSKSKIDEYSLIERDPKTENSFRLLRVPDAVMQEVKKRKRLIDSNKAKYGILYEDHDYISCQKTGQPHALSSMNNALYKLCVRNAVPVITVHGLRHTSVTYKLKLSGGDIKAVQGDSGHAQADMVTEVYGHIIDEDRRKNAELMENAFYKKENLNPQMRGQDGDSKTVAVPDGVDAELLRKVLTNPEMAALLASLAKTMK